MRLCVHLHEQVASFAKIQAGLLSALQRFLAHINKLGTINEETCKANDLVKFNYKAHYICTFSHHPKKFKGFAWVKQS